MNLQLSDHFTYKKLLQFCISPVLMMLFISIYGVVDGLFISNFVGKTPFAAINIIMPFIFILGGFGFMVGTGGSALVAKTLGENDKEKACRYFTMMFEFVILGGIVLSAVSLIFLRQISTFLGADESMIDDCMTYGSITLVFNIVYMVQNLFQNFLITAEKPKIAFWATFASGISNMVLDALFIAVFKWGVAGAAFATGLSECIGAVIPFIYFIRPNRSLLRFKKTKLELKIILKTCSNGFSEIISNSSHSIVSMLYNFQLLKFSGQNGVATYGVIMYIQFIFIAIFTGYTIGVAPIISYHYGAKNNKELKSLLKKSLNLNFFTGAFMSVVSILISGLLSQIFVGYDEALFNMTKHAFSIFSISFVLSGLNIFTSCFFTALNDGVTSAIISVLRSFVFQFTFVLFLPMLFGIEGIWWAIVLSEICSLLVSLSFIIAKRRKYQYI